MQFLFAAVALAGLLYFCTAPRFFDWCSVAYASACVYFLPGFLGYTRVGLDQAPISAETYLVMLAVLVGVLVTAWIIDQQDRRTGRSRTVACQGPQPTTPGRTSCLSEPRPDGNPYLAGAIRYLPLVTTAFAMLGLVAVVRISGSHLLLANKHEMSETFSYWHLLWLMGTPLAFVVSFDQRRMGLCLLTGLSLLFIVYIGNRSQFAVAMIGIVTLSLMGRGRKPLIVRVRTFAGILAFVAFVFCYKQVYIWVKLRDFAAVYETVSDGGFLSKAILNSEPFATQHILNVTAQEDFQIPAWTHFCDVGYAAVSPYLGSSVSFGNRFADTFFCHLDYGLASNIWAEMLSTGGWMLLIAFIGVFLFTLYKASLWCRHNTLGLRGVIVAWMPWWAFYIHRNDTYRMLSFLKQFVLLVIVAWLLAWLLAAFLTPSPSRKAGLALCRREA